MCRSSGRGGSHLNDPAIAGPWRCGDRMFGTNGASGTGLLRGCGDRRAAAAPRRLKPAERPPAAMPAAIRRRTGCLFIRAGQGQGSVARGTRQAALCGIAQGGGCVADGGAGVCAVEPAPTGSAPAAETAVTAGYFVSWAVWW